MPPLVPLPTVMNAEPISMWPAPDPIPPDLPRESITDDDVDVIRAAWKAVREADEADLHLHRIEEAEDADVAAAFLAAVAETHRAPCTGARPPGTRSCMDDPRDLEALEVERDYQRRMARGEIDMLPPDDTSGAEPIWGTRAYLGSAPDMPDAPEEPNLFGIGTYDASKSKSAGKAKGKSKDKSKGKSKGKPKGKNRESQSGSSRMTWRQMYDYWKYDSA